MICATVERCAGIDVGKKFLAVTLMVGALKEEPRTERRRYGTTRGALEGMLKWLTEEGVTHVAMESTGSLLEAGVQRGGSQHEGGPGESAGGEEPEGA